MSKVIIGVFSRNKDGDRFSGYHCSPCKIFKILDEIYNSYGIKYELNNYSGKYEFAIVDRIKPKADIKSRNILNISEVFRSYPWATHNAFVSPSASLKGPNDFHLLNYCHGQKISPPNLNRQRLGGVYVGRYTRLSEAKVKILADKGFMRDVYPIKYWKGKDVLRFHGASKESEDNLVYLQKRNRNITIKKPLNHLDLYSGLNSIGYSFGFVPSIYDLSSKSLQKESSSKFFEYIGCGIPVLIERNVPEAKLVEQNPFLGEIYFGKSDMIKKAYKLNSTKYHYLKILSYSQKNHYPESRAKTIYKMFLNKGL